LKALRFPLGAAIGNGPGQDEEEDDEVDDGEGTATDGEVDEHGETGLELEEGTDVGVMGGGVFLELGDADLEADHLGAVITVNGVFCCLHIFLLSYQANFRSANFAKTMRNNSSDKFELKTALESRQRGGRERERGLGLLSELSCL